MTGMFSVTIVVNQKFYKCSILNTKYRKPQTRNFQVGYKIIELGNTEIIVWFPIITVLLCTLNILT